LELLLATGIRVGELIRLRPADLDLAEGVLRVIGKGNRQRVVFLPGTRVRRLLDSYLARRAALQPRAESLFVADDLRPITAPGVRAFLKEIAKSAGLSRRVTPHLLRHTAATLLLEAGVDIRFVQRLLGHASIMTTQLYTHVSDKALQTAISRARVTDLLARR
jgi:integrase/recombinase XerD